MEAFVLFFVFCLFLYVRHKPAPPPPKSNADKLMEGLLGLTDEVKNKVTGAKPPFPKEEPNPWPMIFLAIFIGIILTYL
jgi:hypothetical protein